MASSTTPLPTRIGTWVSLSDLDAGRRSQRLAALQALESGLRTDGWVRVAWTGGGTTDRLYAAAKALLKHPARERYQQSVLHGVEGSPLGLTYYAIGDEPLYQASTKRQRVRSLNMHEERTPEECDARAVAYVAGSYDAEERALAHAFHAWPSDPDVAELRSAAAAFRHALTDEVAAPLRRAFGALLGLDADYLCSRCQGLRSDNTSLLRVLEYPPAHLDGEVHDETETMGVSEHTDFELFSLLHEQARGLQLCDPSGVWHEPAPSDGGGAWVVIVGDMYARLSGGFCAATPHRVPPTVPRAAASRHSMVFFQGLDEHEAVVPVFPSVARRSPTGGYRRWEEAGGAGGGQRPAGHEAIPTPPTEAVPITQREWTEWKEQAARERLKLTGQPWAQLHHDDENEKDEER
jgi:isopenicillin N synthase-like dioxygenase